MLSHPLQAQPGCFLLPKNNREHLGNPLRLHGCGHRMSFHVQEPKLWHVAGFGRLDESQARLTPNSPGAWPRADNSLPMTSTTDFALWLASTHSSVPGICAGAIMSSGLAAT